MKKVVLIAIVVSVFASSLMSQKHWGSGDGLVLMTPVHNEEISKTTITFEWEYYGNENDINYFMALGENNGEYMKEQDIDPYKNSFTKSGLLRGKQYHWRIICKSGDERITWVDGYFTISQPINKSNSYKTQCSYCKGNGKVIIPESATTCKRCKGTGRYPPDKKYGLKEKCGRDMWAKLENKTYCNGTGRAKIPAHYESCTNCEGYGFIAVISKEHVNESNSKLQWHESDTKFQWHESFQNKATNSFPSNWVADANAKDISNNYVDDVIKFEGDKSLKIYGHVGGCWGALAYKPVDFKSSFTIELAIRNGAENLSGCHPDRGQIGLRKGLHSSNPARQLLRFGGDGKIYGGGSNSFGTYNTNTWYLVRVKYEKISGSQVKLSYWINNDYLGEETFDSIVDEKNLDNFEIVAQEGSVWFDAINFYPDTD